MFSIKDAVRKTVVAVSLAALTTTFFAGCSDKTVSSNDLYPPAITAEVNAPETTDSLTDDINPGINNETHDSNTFSIKYKYWYDNPDVKAAQEETLAQNDPGGDNPDGKTFLNLPGLPLYTDPSGNQYIISGRTIVYLADGKISGTESLLLRDSSGNKIYFMSTDLADFTTKLTAFATKNIKQPTTLEERKANDSEATVENVANKTIYVNNLETAASTIDGKIPLSTIFNTTYLGTLDMSNYGEQNTIKVTMDTAAGFVTVTLVQD